MPFLSLSLLSLVVMFVGTCLLSWSLTWLLCSLLHDWYACCYMIVMSVVDGGSIATVVAVVVAAVLVMLKADFVAC